MGGSKKIYDQTYCTEADPELCERGAEPSSGSLKQDTVPRSYRVLYFILQSAEMLIFTAYVAS